MKKINAKLAVMLVFCILSSAAFVGGIPMIIFDAANHVSIVMIAGIIMTAFDFYACPILWINFGGVVALKAVVKAVEEEKLRCQTRFESFSWAGDHPLALPVEQCVLYKTHVRGFTMDPVRLFCLSYSCIHIPAPADLPAPWHRSLRISYHL